MQNIIAKDSITRLSSLLASAKRVTVVTHTRPDGDAVGSAVAAMCFISDAYGADVKIVLPNAVSSNISFIIPGGREADVMIHEDAPLEVEQRLRDTDLLLCLDFNAFRRTDALEPLLAECAATKVLIDHHLNPDFESFDLVFSTPNVSSACELLFDVLMALPCVEGDAGRIPSESLYALMAGMTTDTNNFANSVYPSTLSMASALLAAGVDRDDVIMHVYNEYRENRLRLIGYLLSQKMTITSKGVAYTVLTKQEQQIFDFREGESEGYVNMPLTIGQVRMSIFLREDEGFFRVSLRSKAGTSANRCAVKYFNGGGHEQASGGRLFIPSDIAGADEVSAYVEKVTEEFFADED